MGQEGIVDRLQGTCMMQRVTACVGGTHRLKGGGEILCPCLVRGCGRDSTMEVVVHARDRRHQWWVIGVRGCSRGYARTFPPRGVWTEGP